MHRALPAISLTLGLALAAEAKHLPPRLAKPVRGAQITVGPVGVPQGSEITECTYLKLPTKRDLAVNRVKIRVRGGSHHIHLYRPQDQTLDLADGHETCNFALDFNTWQLILASQSTFLDWKLPRGVAFRFRAGEQLAAQTHFVDTGLLETPDDGWAVMNLHAIPERKVTAFAGALFGQDRDVVVPPQSIATATTRCVFDHPVKLLALTGHYHFRGMTFTAGSWDGTTGTEIYRQEGYKDPAFVRYGGDGVEVPGIEWTCVYDNPSDVNYTFGPFTDENEHCNLFAWYYPTLGDHEFTTCVQKDHVVDVQVRN